MSFIWLVMILITWLIVAFATPTVAVVWGGILVILGVFALFPD